jgi:hypothetical protein
MPSTCPYLPFSVGMCCVRTDVTYQYMQTYLLVILFLSMLLLSVNNDIEVHMTRKDEPVGSV